MIAVADEAARRSIPFVVLERISEDFMQRHGSSIDEEGQHPLVLADDADPSSRSLHQTMSLNQGL